MEDYKRQTLGAGIIAVSVIQLFIYAFYIFGIAISFFMKDQISDILSSQPGGEEAVEVLNSAGMIISTVLVLLIIISIALILFKKALGVYTYFTCIVINFIYGIVMGSFSPLSFVSLILPGLMALFIYKKKHLYFGDKDASVNTY